MNNLVYIVNLDYKEFFFLAAIDAIAFAETALLHNSDIKVSIEIKLTEGGA